MQQNPAAAEQIQLEHLSQCQTGEYDSDRNEFDFDPEETDEYELDIEETYEYELDDETSLNGTIDYVALMNCSIEISRNVTEEYNLTSIWNAYEPTILGHLANFQNCASIVDSEAAQTCLNVEIPAANETMRVFVGTVRAVSFD